MADRIDEAVKRTKDKFGARQVEAEKFVREDKLKRELGDQFYSNLRAWMHKAEKEFNARYGSRVVIVTEGERGVITVRALLTDAETKQAELSYNDTLQQVTWKTGTGETTHIIRLKFSARDNGMVAEAGTQDLTVEAFGQKVIDGVLP